jgi:hypothetical protein
MIGSALTWASLPSREVSSLSTSTFQTTVRKSLNRWCLVTSSFFPSPTPALTCSQRNTSTLWFRRSMRPTQILIGPGARRPCQKPLSLQGPFEVRALSESESRSGTNRSSKWPTNLRWVDMFII